MFIGLVKIFSNGKFRLCEYAFSTPILCFERKFTKQSCCLPLQDPTGNPVDKENEAGTQVSRLPICNNQLNGHLASLRSAKKAVQRPNHIPFSSLENIGANTQLPDGLSPKVSQINTNYLTELSV